jgi:2-oxoglutarate ferredoxin oxidoreductase subunit beta
LEEKMAEWKNTVDEVEVIYAHPESLTPATSHYCPGCVHGIVHRLIAEVIDELAIKDITIGVAPVGCSSLAYNYIDIDFVVASHGRAPAMATGIKRVQPEKIVFTYQGDGDLAAIGTAEIIHAANRGENLTTVFINNAIYGMTGGQMAPTTLPGMVTTSTPLGRDCSQAGYPIKMSELLTHTSGAAYIARTAALSIASIRKTKQAIKHAFIAQIHNLGFSCVEVLATCPTNWNMDPWDAMEWAKKNMIPYFPLGVFKTPDNVEALEAV